ncbi:hypothetical protein TW83_09875 [Paracoccus sp. S4493]|uniref:hypothetical protein n=1 Tax=Paracoccus sp. S4493 TaxID=579490 RepID=UPI0005FA6D44|nr:hypothetical protein [Paracoccus sp. S4493]KJZ31224.1 hypothetical protein TW83_09875 [Paracoccus sp. S4493]
MLDANPDASRTSSPPMSWHAVQRARERGIISVDPAIVIRAVEAALKAGSDGLVHRVMKAKDGRDIWRFRVDPDGLFYAVVEPKSLRVVTIYNQEMLRGVKRSRKAMKVIRSRQDFVR